MVNQSHLKIQYFRINELPADIKLHDDDGEQITIDYREVIESPLEDTKIPRKFIISKCTVIPASKDDSVSIILQNNQRKRISQMYVCRYKLVRKTVYELLPITWANDVQISDSDDSEIDESINIRSQTSGIESNLGGLTISSGNALHDEDLKLVSPIKIVNNSVQKVKRNPNLKITLSVERKRREDGRSNGNSISDNDHDDDIDENVKSSPNKKAKYIDERNANYLSESPVSKHNSNRRSMRISGVKKNLNDSFREPADTNQNDSPTHNQNYSVVEKHQNEGGMVMKLKRVDTIRPSTPLQEIKLDDNNQANGIVYRNELLDKVDRSLRKSILKVSGSTKGMKTNKICQNQLVSRFSICF